MLIVGLGNPGREYDETRHNVGFWAIDVLARRFRASLQETTCQSQVRKFSFKGQAHVLAKPQTFMNLSGESVQRLMLQQSATTSELLVFVDDVTLPVGRVRLRSFGSAGGHNGLKSIIGLVGEKFWRLRIGVGLEGSSPLSDYVLSSPTIKEKMLLELVLADIPEIATLVIMGFGNKAMSVFNGKDYNPPPPPKPPTDGPPPETRGPK